MMRKNDWSLYQLEEEGAFRCKLMVLVAIMESCFAEHDGKYQSSTQKFSLLLSTTACMVITVELQVRIRQISGSLIQQSIN